MGKREFDDSKVTWVVGAAGLVEVRYDGRPAGTLRDSGRRYGSPPEHIIWYDDYDHAYYAGLASAAVSKALREFNRKAH